MVYNVKMSLILYLPTGGASVEKITNILKIDHYRYIKPKNHNLMILGL